MFAGPNKDATVPYGNFAKASFVSVNAVKGPVPLKVLAKSVATTVDTNVEKLLFPEATSTILGACMYSTSTVAPSITSSATVLVVPSFCLYKQRIKKYSILKCIIFLSFS